MVFNTVILFSFKKGVKFALNLDEVRYTALHKIMNVT